MKILDRYISRELIGPFLFGVAAFTLIFISGQYLFKLTTLLARGASLPDVIELLSLRMVPLAVITFPMATLLATLLSFGRLSGDMEVVALMAGGVSFVRIAVPAFSMGLLVSAFGLYANEFIVPPAGRAAKQTETRITQLLASTNPDIAAPTNGRYLTIPDYENGELARVVIAGSFNFAARRLDRVTYLQYSGKTPQTRYVAVMVEAEHALWNPEQKDQWIFQNGSTYTFLDPHSTVHPSSAPTYHWSGPFVQLSFLLNKSPQQIVAEDRDSEEMSFRELQRYIAILRDQGSSSKILREKTVDLYNKLSIPFSSMVFALVGAPLGLRRLRGGASVGLGLSILIIFCYYVVWHGASVLGGNGQLPPVFASWLANLVGLGVGGALVWRAAN
jgi:lipopolysaccharide export system permease protein